MQPESIATVSSYERGELMMWEATKCRECSDMMLNGLLCRDCPDAEFADAEYADADVDEE